MNPNETLLKTFTNRLDQSIATVEKDFEPLSDTQLNWKPSAKAWSINQCVEHLNMANQLYFKKLERLAAKYGDRLPPSVFAYKPSLMGKLMIWFVDPDGTIKVPAPGMIQPAASALPRNILSQFVANQQQVKEYVKHFENADLNKLKIKSPITSLMVLTLGDVFETISRHSLRHLKQAKRVMAMDGFPKE
jgi:hypothetical protein